MSGRIADRGQLADLRERLRPALLPRLGGAEDDGEGGQVLVCTGGGCLASGAEDVCRAFETTLKETGLDGRYRVVRTGCMGPCAEGPVARVMPGGVFYRGLGADDAAEIVREHLLNGRPVRRLLPRDSGEGRPGGKSRDDYFGKQKKIVLRNCGVVDPTEIDDYIALDGYEALARVLEENAPDAVIDTVLESGLRGRGGGGFPTGMKWRLTRGAKGSPKNVVCNADEGDPGAFMDRSVLEGDPHSVIEGMAVAAHAIGASNGYVYCRAEYPLAIERLGGAIRQARERGLLGRDILGSGFDFDIEIRRGSGAFVCGEETALMTSIEGNRGEPRPRPPFPANQGLWGLPTLLNNVETFANIPPIVLKGAAWYASLGAGKSKGTKVFALAGAVKTAGLVEVPIGIQLGELIYDIGGGVPGGRPFKAAQIGGPSGGCIPRRHLGVSLDYESLTELGAIMGSGGLIVMDDETCMVDVARYFLEFVQEESCGKCTPCRVGTKRLLEILERICAGNGEEEDIERLVELGNEIKKTALCGLGKTAANPVLSTLRHFRDEYVDHIRYRRCPAGVCPSLVRAPCQSACPASVDVPGFVALTGEKRYAEALRLHRERNPFAAACARVCFHTCEDHCRRATLDGAVSIRSVKRFMVDQEVTVQVPEVRSSDANAARRVVVVGAGPAGLSCAYFLARLGYRPRVLEAQFRPGGMMVQAIPAYRLPREILAREIRMLERIGVRIETGVELGRHVTLEGLRREGAEAVFIALGAPEGKRLNIPGEENRGVTEALGFLREYNIRGSVPVGRNVVVCGGGNAAVDAARTALRLGAESVTIVYRRTREEMPAYAEEIEEAEHEGIVLRMLTAPVEIVGDGGSVTGLKCRRMRLGDFDPSGRRRPEAGDAEDFVIPCDQVIAAIGQNPSPPEVLGSVSPDRDERGYLAVEPSSGRTSVPWLFAGGDAVSGPSSVIEAVASGERAAAAIDRALTGEDHAFWRDDREVPVPVYPDQDPTSDPRENLPLISIERRRNNFDEVELPWDEQTAVRQAKRCLRCDYKA
ncbi:MAG TPA: NADH-ubiquinone oxidoreductase-F iron-sulfur binding region domain-containing protein [bacterium]|nr:NADH-ubiquinone oxidoreductase-F iron-sulfur binding region domain-containing protein [bacterium]HPQ65755.1 NADH-ubiquinone oxidoreductase-F iron-sulfur binding region domain-containing protein [bacterium]